MSALAITQIHLPKRSTKFYVEATLAMKEQALAKTTPLHGKAGRFRPTDQLLAFLNSL